MEAVQEQIMKDKTDYVKTISAKMDENTRFVEYESYSKGSTK